MLWMKELGPEVARQAEGSQPTQPNPNPNHDRTERLVVAENTCRSSDQEIDTRFFRDCKNANLEEEANPDRTGKPVVSRQPVGSSSTFNEVDIEYLDCHIQLRNKRKILVFVSSSRRSRTTLIDKIFKAIYNKIMPTTHLVKKSKKMIKDIGAM